MNKKLVAGIVAALVAVVTGVGIGQKPKPWSQAIEHRKAQAVLSVEMRFDYNEMPALKIIKVKAHHGHPDVPAPDGSGYELTVHDADYTVSSGFQFEIPEIVPPPPEDGTPAEPFTPLSEGEFVVTIPFPDGAGLVTLTDRASGDVLSEYVVDKHGRPEPLKEKKFKSYHPGKHSAVPDAEASAGVFDIAIIGDNYTAADAALYESKVNAVIADMMQYEPYKSRPGKVVFHRIDNYTVDLLCKHSATTTRLITCGSPAYNEIAASGAPADGKIVLVKDSSYGGSGGSLAVSYDGTSMKPVVRHESGHAMLRLSDNYNLYGTNGPVQNAWFLDCWAGPTPPPAPEGYVWASGCRYPNWKRLKFKIVSGTTITTKENLMHSLSPGNLTEKQSGMGGARIDSVAGTP